MGRNLHDSAHLIDSIPVKLDLFKTFVSQMIPISQIFLQITQLGNTAIF